MCKLAITKMPQLLDCSAPSLCLTVYAIVFLVTYVPRGCHGCFPVNEVFDGRYLWIQPIDLQSRWLISIRPESPDIMELITEGPVDKKELKLRCLRAYSKNRYLVRREDPDGPNKYQCMQFTPLTERVVRQWKSRTSSARKKIHCTEENYMEDESVLINTLHIPAQACPLSGGYQLIMHEGQAVHGRCLDSVQTYNPRIQFECDAQSSGHAIVEFGEDCEPPALTKAQKMRQRHIAHLNCVGSWEENGYKSVLLNMRDQPSTFWCLHYRPVAHGKKGMVTSEGEEFLSVFLTLDGRCSPQAFDNEDVPRVTSMFGFLASYRPGDDLKCTEKAYVNSCQMTEDKCFESTECPSNCGRCKKQLTMLNCSFTSDMRGKWKVVSSFRKLEITIDKNTIQGSEFGNFMCRSPPESGTEKNVYPVVQTGVVSTCMPYYACAQIYSPAPGMLSFRLRPAIRDQETSEPYSCRETHEKLGYVVPVPPERTVTLLNVEKLRKTNCNHLFSSTYPTMQKDCLIAVQECSGDCQTLQVGYDIQTCGNESNWVFNIDTKHTCYATVELNDGVRGVLTQSPMTKRYLCWIFGSTRLFVAKAEECNQYTASEVFKDPDAYVRYDPLNAISMPVSANSSSSSFGANLIFMLILKLLLYLSVCNR